MLWPESEELSDYDLLILPALYTADEQLLQRIAGQAKLPLREEAIQALACIPCFDQKLKCLHGSHPHARRGRAHEPLPRSGREPAGPRRCKHTHRQS